MNVSCLSLLANADDICRLWKIHRRRNPPPARVKMISSAAMPDEPKLILKRAHGPARKLEDDYDVLFRGEVVGRIFKSSLRARSEGADHRPLTGANIAGGDPLEVRKALDPGQGLHASRSRVATARIDSPRTTGR
jgi:hypothetical protein